MDQLLKIVNALKLAKNHHEEAFYVLIKYCFLFIEWPEVNDLFS